MNFICNLSPSPEDRRDFIYVGDTSLNIPNVLDYRDTLKPPRHQGEQGTCYAQAVACVKEWQENKDYGFTEYFSPQFFYNNRPNILDDNEKNDSGMFTRDVMKLLKNVGICREKVYPYGRIEKPDQIPKKIFEEAKAHTIKGFAKVTELEKVKLCLQETGPCLITFPTFNYSNEFWIEKQGDKKKGGHAVAIVGYNKEGFIIRNSWGMFWGDKGYSIYKYSDWGIHWEIWCIVDNKTPLEKIQKFNLKTQNNSTCCIIS